MLLVFLDIKKCNKGKIVILSIIELEFSGCEVEISEVGKSFS